MKNRYKSKFLSIVLLACALVILTGTASADITMQGGNVIGQANGLSAGVSSAGAKAVAMTQMGTGSAGSNTGIDVNSAAGTVTSSADANAATSPDSGVAISTTVAWGNSENGLGGFAYDVNIGTAKPGATVETTSHAGVDLSKGGQSAVEYGTGNPGIVVTELPSVADPGIVDQHDYDHGDTYTSHHPYEFETEVAGFSLTVPHVVG